MGVRNSDTKTWKNTFAPDVSNKYFTVAQLFGGVRHGRIGMSDLPPDAQKAVQKIVEEVYGK